MTAYGSLISDLENAIASGTDERRVETLWHVTDLFITDAGLYSEDQIALFDDVIGRLAADIEVKARAKLASRLAPVANAPVKVIKFLAFDDAPEVAAPVLSRSERLDDESLIDNAKTKSQQHLLAISQRKTLSEPVTDVLVARGNLQVVRTVTKNAGARFSDAGFGVLVRRSEGDDVLAEQVGSRKDIPRHHFLKLVANASDAVKRKLAAADPKAAEEIQRVLAEVVGKIRAEAVTASEDYGAARQSVETLARGRALTENDLYQLAKARKFEETSVAFSKLCGLPIDVVETAMLDDRPDMVLILAKATGLSWTTAKAVLLLRASGRGISALDLEKALKSFERLQVEIARRVVQFYEVRQAAEGA